MTRRIELIPRISKLVVAVIGLLSGAVLLISGGLVSAAGGGLDTTFNSGTGANEIVVTSALQPDGKIIIGGSFTIYNGTSRQNIARLNPDGSLDNSFDPGTGANDRVLTIAMQPDGKIIIGGNFNNFNGTTRNTLARLNADGSLDTSFDPGSGANSIVQSAALQPDGKIIIGGSFTSYKGTARNRVARLNSDGSLDTSFDPGAGANSFVQSALVQPDGKIIVGGNFNTFNGTARVLVARLNSDGSLDSTFVPATGGNGFGTGVFKVLSASGKVIIVGTFTFLNSNARNVARLNSDGSLDTTFNVGRGADLTVTTAALQPDGKLVIGGSFTNFNGTSRTRIARLTSNGSIDSTFDTGAGTDDTVFTATLQADGKIFIGGLFTTYNGTSSNHVARLLPAPGFLSFSSATYSVSEGGGSATITLKRTGGTDNKVAAKVSLTDVTTSSADYVFTPGTLESTFDPGAGANNHVYTMALQPDGKVVIGGDFTNYNGTQHNGIVRLNADGTQDTSFDSSTDASGGVLTSTLQPDGRVIIGGFFTSYNGVSRPRVARINSDGTLDTTFNPGAGADDTIFATAVQPDGKAIIGGNFTNYNGTPRNHIARLNVDGTLDTTFNSGTGANGAVVAMTTQADGKVILGGTFNLYNGVSRSCVARINPDGSLDTSFDPGIGANSNLGAVAVQVDGKIILGGFFTSYNGVPRRGIARANADGSLDTSFNPGAGADNVEAIAVQPDGKIIIGGGFTSYDGASRKNIARLNADGSLDIIFNPGTGPGHQTFPTALSAAVLQPDGKVIIGGFFSSYNGVARNFVARLDGDLFVTWEAGDASDKTISLPIVDDNVAEQNEALTLTLIPLAGGAMAGAPSTATLTIMDNDTSISLISGAGVFAGTASLSATLNLGGSGLSGKTVSFTLNGTAVCGGGTGVTCPTTDASGVATLTGVSLAGINAGTFQNAVGAAFAGDTNFSGSSGTGALSVSKVATTTVLSSSANPSESGQSVTFTATVTSAAGKPSGTITFKDNGSAISTCTNVALSTGQVACATSALTVGSHTITADYSGDSNFNSSTGTLSTSQVVAVSLFNFSQATYTVNERDGSVMITVRRTGDTTQAASVDYATDDGSIPSVAVPCSSVTGLALERCDYTMAAGTLSFAAGDTQKTFNVLVNDDSYAEGTEVTHLRLSNANGAALAQQSSATLQITDDTQQTTNPVDDASFFVRQHYHDFLNREPDTSGFNFWANQMTNCGASDTAVCRVNVSASFFLSIEFQQTGYLVERVYKVAYGDAQGTSSLGGTQHPFIVPVVRLQEFLPDTQEIQSRPTQVVVGQGNWQQQLEDNKNAFALEFVGRARFTSAFPSTMTADAFVNQLNTNAGQVLTPADISQLDSVFGGPLASSSDASKRALVLRQVAENASLQQHEFDRAFVLMQYFGYLKRNPNDAPDTDYTGYEFWLQKLDQFHGNFINAEMVKAFISADEYRHRFGQ